LLALSLVIGCAQKQNRPPLSLVVGIDTSGSARPYLAAYVAGTKQVAMGIQPKSGDRLTVYRFDRVPSEIYDGPRPTSLEHLASHVIGQVAPEASRSGTLPSELIDRIVKKAKSEPNGPPIIVVVFTDGGNDDLSGNAAKRAQDVALEVAESPRIQKVVFAGLATGLRESVRDRYAAMGPKFAVAELANLKEVLR
jgi:hypothetical protein